MHRNQFNNKYSALNINAAEMERKWAVYQREQEEMNFYRIASPDPGTISETTPSYYMDDDYIIDQQNYIP